MTNAHLALAPPRLLLRRARLGLGRLVVAAPAPPGRHATRACRDDSLDGGQVGRCARRVPSSPPRGKKRCQQALLSIKKTGFALTKEHVINSVTEKVMHE